jgi:N-acyl-D-amino-acid deacylase
VSGVELVGHLAPRAVGNVLQWGSRRRPFMDRPSVRAISKLHWPEQLARLRDAAFRDQVLSVGNGDAEARRPEFARMIYRGFDRMYEVADYPDYEPDAQRDSIAALAAAEAQTLRHTPTTS